MSEQVEVWITSGVNQCRVHFIIAEPVLSIHEGGPVTPF